MNAVEHPAEIDPDIKAKLQAACDRVALGIVPTMNERRAAAAIVDLMREANARVFGVQSVTLEAIRQSRREG